MVPNTDIAGYPQCSYGRISMIFSMDCRHRQVRHLQAVNYSRENRMKNFGVSREADQAATALTIYTFWANSNPLRLLVGAVQGSALGGRFRG